MVSEIAGLFVEDQGLATTIALALALILAASVLGIATPTLRAIALFVGLSAALLLSVYRFRISP